MAEEELRSNMFDLDSERTMVSIEANAEDGLEAVKVIDESTGKCIGGVTRIDIRYDVRKGALARTATIQVMPIRLRIHEAAEVWHVAKWHQRLWLIWGMLRGYWDYNEGEKCGNNAVWERIKKNVSA